MNTIIQHKNNYKYIHNIVIELITGHYIPHTPLINNDYIEITLQHIQFKQYYTYLQKGGNICGFHALFNLIKFISYIQRGNSRYLSEMKSPWHFWKCYIYTIKELLLSSLHIEHTGVKSLLNGGPLERYQFNYLLTQHSYFSNIVKDVTYVKFFYGFNRINGMSFNDIIEFQSNVDVFISSSYTNQYCVVLMGVTNHWTILIVEKTGNDNNNSKYNYYYLDSRNVPYVFGMKDKERFIKESIIRSELYCGCKPVEWWVYCLPIWVDDINRSMNILGKVFTKKVTLYDVYIEQCLKEMICLYEEFVGCELNNVEKGNEELMCKTKEWLEKKYHPVIFKESVVNNVEAFKERVNKDNVEGWMKFRKWLEIVEGCYEWFGLRKKNTGEDEDLFWRYYEEIKKIKWVLM